MTESFHPPEGIPLEVREVDGAPDVLNVSQMRVSNGSLTDVGGGVVSVITGGGTGITPAWQTTTGAACTGASGAVNRTLTLTNVSLTTGQTIYVGGRVLFEGVGLDYTIVHNAIGSVVTFLKNLFDAQDILVVYYV